MDINEIVSRRMQMLNPKYDDEYLCSEYSPYIETVCEFEGSKEILYQIIKLYKEELKNYIMSNNKLIEVIMQKDGIHRHDLDIVEEVDLDFVIDSIFTNQQLEGFSERTKNIIFFEAMNMYNIYGIETLKTKKEVVSKEMSYGIYMLKTDPNKNLINERDEQQKSNEYTTENYEELMRLGEKYGKEALPYIKHLEILKKRVDSLVDLVPPLLQKNTISLSETIFKIITAKNDINSELPIEVDVLEEIYKTYVIINNLTLKHLMATKLPNTIDKPMGELLMLHFIQDENETAFDKKMNSFLDEEVLDTIREMISKKNGRPYNEQLDKVDFQMMIEQYNESRKNPANFDARIPLRCQYVGKSGGKGFATVITKPTTQLSVSVSTPEELKIHLNRRIAIGFFSEDIPTDAILATSKTFNSEKDRIDFLKGKESIVEIMDYNKKNTRANETLIDWTKIKAGYILVVKDKEILEPELLARAELLGEKNNIPIVIFDEFKIKQHGINNNIENTDTNSTGKH